MGESLWLTRFDRFRLVRLPADGPITNAELHAKVANIAGLSEAEINTKTEIGKAKAQHSPIKSKIRWFQQTLKSMNIIQKVDGERGIWKLASKNKKGFMKQ
ncbi:winged helix-turn-helix domain-containing protein [Vibrio coralliilyticus]|uniref:winged helix-turn-helix domain-containing protein n=1 Tax=Vibrio coralliilyticus TaxID=190893 RepID=UPI001F5B4375|nr:winged helix-turn-helix domain-containing protein [Vibrio coralliilyticus]